MIVIIRMLDNPLSKVKAKEVLTPRLAPFSKIFLRIVVLINSSVIAPYLRHIDWKLIEIAGAVFLTLFAAITYPLLSAGYSKVAITFLGGMRNISVGAVVAVSYFPAKGRPRCDWHALPANPGLHIRIYCGPLLSMTS